MKGFQFGMRRRATRKLQSFFFKLAPLLMLDMRVTELLCNGPLSLEMLKW